MLIVCQLAVERFGKFHGILEPGLNLVVPFVDRIAYAHSLKEEALSIPNQMAITSDNVTLQVSGCCKHQTHARLLNHFPMLSLAGV